MPVAVAVQKGGCWKAIGVSDGVPDQAQVGGSEIQPGWLLAGPVQGLDGDDDLARLGRRNWLQSALAMALRHRTLCRLRAQRACSRREA